MKRLLVGLLAFLAVAGAVPALFPPLALAHNNNSHGYMDVRADRDAARVDLTLDYLELRRVVLLPINPLEPPGQAGLEQALRDSSDLLRHYLTPRVRVWRDGLLCEPRIDGTGVRTIADRPQAVIQLVYPCGGMSTRFHYDVFFEDNDESHQNIARLTAGGRETEFIFTVAERELTVGAASLWRQAWQFVRLGVEHIFTGYDHILFVLSLLVAARNLGAVAKIVTAFTVGHSITLALATLGLVNLPAHLVEPAIALSIIYVAAQNLRRRETGHGWIVTLLFGLVHGFGFANILREMELSRSGLAISLFCFNIGVEFGQIAIVSAVYPLLNLVRRFRIYPRVAFAASASALAMGLFWFVQRMFA